MKLLYVHWIADKIYSNEKNSVPLNFYFLTIVLKSDTCSCCGRCGRVTVKKITQKNDISTSCMWTSWNIFVSLQSAYKALSITNSLL